MTEEQTAKMAELNDTLKIIRGELDTKVATLSAQPLEVRLEILDYARQTYNKLFDILRDISLLENDKKEMKEDVYK